MSDEHKRASDARSRLFSDIGRMRRGETPAAVAELSDRAALLVAVGMTTHAVRTVVVRRLHNNLPMPTIGGFAQLRLLQEQRFLANEILARNPGSVLRLAVRTRLAELERRYGAYQSAFIRGMGSFATKGRDIRNDRRAGVHLDFAERAELFEALVSTPTLLPMPVIPASLFQLGGAAAARGRREFDRIPVPARMRAVVDSLPNIPVFATETRQGLPEMYTALIMEAGALYDRLGVAYRRGGALLDEVRLQFDAENELADISYDVSRIRQAAIESAIVPVAKGLTDHTGLGPQLDAVWSEIVDRVVAFRELVESAESRVRSELARVERLRRTGEEFGGIGNPNFGAPNPVDEVAEHLVGGSGNRELSTETMRRLRGQIDPGT